MGYYSVTDVIGLIFIRCCLQQSWNHAKIR